MEIPSIASKYSLTRMIKGIIASFTQFSIKSNENDHYDFWRHKWLHECDVEASVQFPGLGALLRRLCSWIDWTKQHRGRTRKHNHTEPVEHGRQRFELWWRNHINQCNLEELHTKNSVVDLCWCYALVLNRLDIKFGHRGPPRAYWPTFTQSLNKQLC